MKKISIFLFIFLFPLVSYGATMTFYPDPSPPVTAENATICYSYAAGKDWSTIQTATSLTGSDSVTNYSNSRDPLDTTVCGASTVGWQMGNQVATPMILLQRVYFLFDTSGLPANATLTGATLSVFGTYKNQGGNVTEGIDIVSSSPASTTAIVSADYNVAQFGGGIFSSTTYASFASGTYNNFVLNTAGIKNISTSTVSKFAIRMKYDVDNIQPTYVTNNFELLGFSGANHTGTSQDPKLVVTYTVPSSGSSRKIRGVGISR